MEMMVRSPEIGWRQSARWRFAEKPTQPHDTHSPFFQTIYFLYSPERMVFAVDNTNSLETLHMTSIHRAYVLCDDVFKKTCPHDVFCSQSIDLSSMTVPPFTCSGHETETCSTSASSASSCCRPFLGTFGGWAEPTCSPWHCPHCRSTPSH